MTLDLSPRSALRVGVLTCFSLLAAATAAYAQPPAFSKSFSPPTIGPGSVSTLRFDIVDTVGTPISDLAFSDSLPAGVVIATPANGSSGCSGTLSAPDGGGTITFFGGSLGGFSSCAIVVDVTSSTAGTHSNVTGDLTSDAGNSGTASADLTVATDRPGFSKSFAPSALVGPGGRSTLTFTIDNTANPSFALFLSFVDNLPAGTIVADPANSTTNCSGAVVDAGASVISLGGGAYLVAGAICTVGVDVIGVSSGTHVNVTEELTSFSFTCSTLSSGKASDTLSVPISSLFVVKSFTDDPVSPGGTVTLELTVSNRSRADAASSIAFDDDLDATLSGLQAVGLPLNNICGAGSQLSGTSLLSFTGGSLLPGGSCTFNATLQVPAGAITGAYPNTTTAVTANLGGVSFVGNPASETLFVNEAPLLTKTFLTDPIGAGGSTTIEFTIDNISTTSSATDIAFLDNLGAFLSGVVVTSLPAAGLCGVGSSMTATIIGGDLYLTMTGGNLAAEDSCTFTVGIMTPLSTPAGTYTNDTEPISAMVDDITQVGHFASDTLTVVGAPLLRKELTDDPVVAGDPVTLEFTIVHDALAPSDATSITFTDNLDAALTGLLATGLPMNDVCGVGSVLSDSGTPTLTLTGGTLTPGETCVFGVTLQTPLAALPGQYPNTTSNLVATVAGVTTIGNPGFDTLEISGLTLTKQFTDDPVVPGGTVTLELTINNTGASDATAMSFTDDLAATLSGLVPTGLPMANICGVGSSLDGVGAFLVFTGGNLTAGTSCTFSVSLAVPAGAASNTYANTTSNLVATYGGSSIVLPPATDALVVSGDLLLLTKEFTDDPTPPGGTVTLQFSITNLDPAQAATGISFTDDLGAALAGLTAVGLPAAGVCGGGSQIAGTTLLTLTGGDLAAGASCTFSVTVMVPAGAPLGTTATNITSQVTGTIGGLGVTGDPASDDLLIQILGFSKAFDNRSTAGGTPVLTFTILNLSATDTVTGLSFSDDLDAVIAGLVATGLPATDVCGLGSILSGTSFLTFTGGSLLPGGSCSFMVDLLVPVSATPGAYTNTTTDLSSGGLPVGPPASDVLEIEPPPTFAKAFVPGTIGVGQSSLLTFTIDNSASLLTASGLDFTDNLPGGVVVGPGSPTVSCTGGTLTATPGTGAITYTGGSVGSASVCTIAVDTTASGPGAFVNVSGDLTSSSGNSGPASATLTAVPQPGFAKSFAPNPIVAGGVSTLTFTIDNTGSIVAATALDFTDNLPVGVVVAAPSNATTTCAGGTLTAVSGTGIIAYTGGTAAASTSCTVQADVTSTAGGSHVNLTGNLTSNLGSSGPATDTLIVQLIPPTFSKAFAPGVIGVGGTSILSFTIDNTTSAVAIGGLDFTDSLPAAIQVANPASSSTTCTGGAITAVPGGGVIAYTGGAVAAGATCQVDVDVTSSTDGVHTNTTGDLTSDAGSSGTATADLTVVQVLVTTKTFLLDPVLPGGFVDLELTITNPSSFTADTIAFTDDLSAVVAGLVAVGLPIADVCGAGSQLAGTTVISLTNGQLGPGASCTFGVTLQVPGTAAVGSYPNTTSGVTFDIGLIGLVGSPAVDDLDVTFLGFFKFFPEGSVLAGGMTALSFTIQNPDVVNTATGITFTDDLDAMMPGTEAINLPMSAVCGSGSLIDGTSLVALTGGTLGPSESCTFEIVVMVPGATPPGDYTNVTSVLEAMVNGALVVGSPGTEAMADLGVTGNAIAIPTLPRPGMILLIILLAVAGARYSIPAPARHHPPRRPPPPTHPR